MTTVRRLAFTLRPETRDERRALVALERGQVASIVVMVERAVKHAFLAGAELGRREVEEEHARP